MFETEFLDIPPLLSAGGVVHLPGSKSISNRVLLLAALSQGQTTVHDLLASDDTAVMLAALRQLGCSVTQTGNTAVITGLGDRSVDLLVNSPTHLFLGNAGTAMRPLTAALALLASSSGGEFELSGVARMHERPIADLVDALRPLGCQIDYLGQAGFPPLRLRPGKLKLSGPIQVRGDVSSQFLTALLLALPLLARFTQQDIRIEVLGELISRPYIEITLNLLERFGIAVQQPGGAHDGQTFVIPAASRYQSPGVIHVEGDASSASYFIALGAIAASVDGQKGIEIVGVGADSIQGDIRFADAAQAMGAQIEYLPNALRVSRGLWPLRAVDLDCNHMPDAAMTLAVMALYAQGTTRLRNIASWRVKETDRIAAMACELQKLGASVEAGADYLNITPPQDAAAWRSATIHTYDDHRIAMCFSLAAFNPAHVPVRILDPGCVAKTFPAYFESFLAVTQTQTAHIPVICMDGPSASGKGTLAALTAQRLGYHLLDSGMLYRMTAFVATQLGVSHDDAPALAQIARSLPVRFEGERIFWGVQDVSEAIRSEASGMAASKVSAYPEVREALLQLQKSFRQLPGLVADGRDMGTVVFPDAPLKIYLTASAQHRAERRHKQLISKGNSATITAILQDLEARDVRDSSRAAAPLKPAKDARLLDNSDLSIKESVDQVIDWWQGTRPF